MFGEAVPEGLTNCMINLLHLWESHYPLQGVGFPIALTFCELGFFRLQPLHFILLL